MKFLFSMSLTGALLLVFAITIGIATFIENDFGAASSQAFVYKSLWFELLLALMVVNMIGVIIIRRLYVKEKWGSLLFHVAFIIILLGAAITRFTGQEGLMHIREGQTATTFLTDETYISGTVLVGDEKVEFSEKVLFVPIKKSKFSEVVHVGDIETSVSLLKHIPNAQEIVETNAEEGEPILTIVIAGANGGRENMYLRRGQVINLNNLVIGFDAEENVAINVKFTTSGLMMNSLIPVDAFSMDTEERKVINPDSLVNAPFRHLLTANNVNFVLSSFNPQGQIMLVSAPSGNAQGTIDALVFSVKQGEYEK